MDALDRHNALMRVYTSTASRSSHHTKNNNVSQHDLDVLAAHHQFLRDDDADAANGASDWQVRMSVRYYRRLFREYALADLSRCREGKVGLRWRTEREVVTGKGQFVCGNKRCDARAGLRSYELLFAYAEHDARKQCLVKVRVCEPCAAKLFHRKLAALEAQAHAGALERQQKQKQKRRKRRERREAAAARDARHDKRRRGGSSTRDSDSGSNNSDYSDSNNSDYSDSSNSDSSNNSDTDDKDARVRRSVHDQCAAINARDSREQRARGSVFFEDRAGSRSSARDAFRDLLV